MGRLFWKFFLSILLAQLTATVGIGGAFWLNDRARQQQRARDIDTSPPAEMAIEAAAATLEFGGADALRGLLAGMQRQRVFAVDADGHDVLRRPVNPLMLSEARSLLEQGGPRQGGPARHAVRDARAPDGRRYLLFQPAEAGAPGPDMAGPPPGMPRHPGYRTLIPLVAATLASLLFAFLLAWYFSRPIRALRQAFEAAAGGDLAPRFKAGAHRRGDELSDLGRDFDHMSGRLRALIDAQTRLLHDVSHELRSPLARLQAAIGLAHQQPDKAHASLERIERESERMDKLVGELLTLSRLEAGAHAGLNEEVCIDELVDAIVDDARFEAAARGVGVALEGQSGALVTGQADLLGRALENVVRNAIKHSPAGATVRIEVDAPAGARPLRIAVLDRGPGVAQADLAAIFQPFFRASEQNSTEGHGLGLAIARHVILAHRGSIGAHNRADGGLCVEMLLPAMPAGEK